MIVVYLETLYKFNLIKIKFTTIYTGAQSKPVRLSNHCLYSMCGVETCDMCDMGHGLSQTCHMGIL